MYTRNPTIQEQLSTYNLPMNINNRLSRLSANEEIFNEAAPPYQQALIDSEYEHILKFQPNIRSNNWKKRNRNRKCLWFNPPWSSNVKSNIGAQFLRIISECFPRGHILHKVFNRNNVKVSYRTMDNVKKIVSRHNMKIINNQNPPPPPPPFRCRTLSPLFPNECKNKDVVYLCRVESHHQTIKMLRLTQASPLRLLKKDGINTCLTVGGERVQPLLHILGNSKQRALMLTSLPIYIGPSKRMQHLSTQFQINVCSAYGKNILFYMNHGMLHSTLLYNIVQTQYCTAFIYVDIPSSVRQNI